jgi:hypothetical protein
MKTLFILFILFKIISQQQCELIIPTNPLTSKGLSTPYILKNCDQTNQDFSVFAEAVIYNNFTQELSVYSPLIINSGTSPLIDPVVPLLKDGDIVGIWIGSNNNIKLSTKNSLCIDGSLNSPFGQVLACNSENFFSIVNIAIKNNLLKIPELGTGSNGKKCYTTRSFQVVDQDQSDNVVSTYLSIGNRTAQYSINNLNKLTNNKTNPIILSNGSDNGLLDRFILPSLSCKVFEVPDLVNIGGFRGALALNEIQASLYQKQPIALIPAGDPMTFVHDQPNLNKLNLMRMTVNQPKVGSISQAPTKLYCLNLLRTGLLSIINDSKFTMIFKSPKPDVADNLFSFLVMRFLTTFGNAGLNCTNILQFDKRIKQRGFNGEKDDIFSMIDNVVSKTSKSSFYYHFIIILLFILII